MGLILAVLLALNYFGFRERLITDAQTQARLVADGSANRIDATLSGFRSLVDGIALTLSATSLELSLNQVRALQEGALREHPDLYGVALAWQPDLAPAGWGALAPYSYRQDGRLAYQDLGRDQRDYLRASWFTEPQRLGRAVWTEPYLENTGTAMVTYAVPIWRAADHGRVFVGVVTCDLALDWLDAQLAEQPRDDNSRLLLLSRQGLYLSHPEKTLRMTLSAFSQGDASRLGGAQQQSAPAMAEQGSGMTSWLDSAADGAGAEKVWLAWDTLPTTGWVAVALISQAELQAAILALTRFEALAGLSGLLVLFIAVGWLARSVTGPIAALSEAAPRVAAGDLDSPLPRPTTEDEVARLALAFKEMRDQLKRYMKNLAESAAARERIEGELRIARGIQMDLLPKELETLAARPELDLAAIIEPAREVGGDYYDLVPLDEDHLLLIIADVSGKGIPAALFMAVTRSLLRSESKTASDPAKLLTRLNDALSEQNDSCMFVTLFCALIHLSDGTLVYANAGHNPPLWLPRQGEPRWLDSPSGLAAGPIAGARYQSGRLSLAADDALLLYTDGVTEALDAKERAFGTDRLLALMLDYRELECGACLRRLVRDLRIHAGQAPQSDDITMVMLRWRGTAGSGIRPRRSG